MGDRKKGEPQRKQPPAQPEPKQSESQSAAESDDEEPEEESLGVRVVRRMEEMKRAQGHRVFNPHTGEYEYFWPWEPVPLY